MTYTAINLDGAYSIQFDTGHEIKNIYLVLYSFTVSET